MKYIQHLNQHIQQLSQPVLPNQHIQQSGPTSESLMQYVQVLQQTRINRIQAQEKELGAFTNKFS